MTSWFFFFPFLLFSFFLSFSFFFSWEETSLQRSRADNLCPQDILTLASLLILLLLNFWRKNLTFFFSSFSFFLFYFSSIPFLLLLLIHPRSSREEALNEGLFLVLLTGFSCSRSLNSTLQIFSVWSCLLPHCIKSSALHFPLPLLFACQAPFKTKVTIPCWEGGLRERRSRKTTAHEEKASHLGLCSPADCYHFPELQHLPLFTNGCCGEAGVCARSNPFW